MASMCFFTGNSFGLAFIQCHFVFYKDICPHLVLACFSCHFTLSVDTCDFSIAPIIREAYVTLIRSISIGNKENKMSCNNGVEERASVLKRQKQQ